MSMKKSSRWMGACSSFLRWEVQVACGLWLFAAKRKRSVDDVLACLPNALTLLQKTPRAFGRLGDAC